MFPQRHDNHSLEAKSHAFFLRQAPATWNINEPNHDYGHDLYVEISEDGQLRGLEFIVQLKSAHQSNQSDAEERQSFRVSTYNYLRGNLRVVVIVKYVETEDEAYWILLKDVPEPDPNHDTFTIRIPRANRLSAIDWGGIKDHVQEVTNRKLGR